MKALNLDFEAIQRAFQNSGYECDIIGNGRVVNVYVLTTGIYEHYSAYERFGTATYVGNGYYEVYSLNNDYIDPVDTVKIN